MLFNYEAYQSISYFLQKFSFEGRSLFEGCVIVGFSLEAIIQIEPFGVFIKDYTQNSEHGSA